MTSKEIRKAFLDFFASKGHQIVPSAPMVVKNDPTLMFTNAGMNQFKDWFLGNSPAKWKRVADSQKCLRVSGKHNDLEEVGRDTYHHTMFEMLGNWSFGDYFKVEAIDWAWELLTEVYKLDKERLYATVFEGSEADGTTLDVEAMEAWKKHLPEDRILLGNKKDNFWEMGDTGPCGPCSEIHIDLRSDEERAAVPGASLVNKDHHLVIEICIITDQHSGERLIGTASDAFMDHPGVRPAVARQLIKSEVLHIAVVDPVKVDGDAHFLVNAGIFVVIEVVLFLLFAKGDPGKPDAQFADVLRLIPVAEDPAAGHFFFVKEKIKILFFPCFIGKSILKISAAFKNFCFHRKKGSLFSHKEGQHFKGTAIPCGNHFIELFHRGITFIGLKNDVCGLI